MAAKSNKGRNRRAAAASSSNSVVNSSAAEVAVQRDSPAAEDNTSKDELSASEAVETVDNAVPAVETDVAGVEESQGESGTENPAGQPKQGDLHLYPISVKTQSGEKLQLQLNPGDSVMDIRQFLLDAPETCFFTCYDLVLHTKDGSTHHLQDFNEISEVADITTGGCFLKMVPALYDDRSIRAHVHRTRDLLSLSTLHSSLSTSLALKYEKAQKTAAATGVTEDRNP